MPYDSNGNFSLVPSYFVQDGDDVLPSQHNPPLEDIGSGLSQVILRNGVAPLTGNLNANGNKIINLAAPTNPNDALRLTDLRDRFRFKANKNGTNQTLTDTPTIVTFGTEVYDIGGMFDTATSRFTPPDGRAFRIYAQLAVQITSGQRSVECRLLKNGTAIAIGYDNAESSMIANPKVADVVVGNGTDYYEIQINSLTSSGAYPIRGAITDTFFMAEEL